MPTLSVVDERRLVLLKQTCLLGQSERVQLLERLRLRSDSLPALGRGGAQSVPHVQRAQCQTAALGLLDATPTTHPPPLRKNRVTHYPLWSCLKLQRPSGKPDFLLLPKDIVDSQ